MALTSFSFYGNELTLSKKKIKTPVYKARKKNIMNAKMSVWYSKKWRNNSLPIFWLKSEWGKTNKVMLIQEKRKYRTVVSI